MTRPTSPTRPKLLTRLRHAIRVRHMSYATEKSYVAWVRRFVLYHGKRHPEQLAEAEVNAFLNHLAVDRHVSASTQTQALSAILFLYRHVLDRELGEFKNLVRAKKKPRLPVVLNADEVRAIFEHTTGVPKLVLMILYGSGLRLAEALRLRIKDLDFTRREITVREGKGNKDRYTMLPERLVAPLEIHLRDVKALHEQDQVIGFGCVQMPHALGRKYPRASAEWPWQYVFPSHRLSKDPRDGITRRHHLYPQTVRRAMRVGMRQGGITKHATVHALRHSFATSLLIAGYDIRTVQELLGHKNVRTTMVYTHVLNRGGSGVRSPADAL